MIGVLACTGLLAEAGGQRHRFRRHLAQLLCIQIVVSTYLQRFVRQHDLVRVVGEADFDFATNW